MLAGIPLLDFIVIGPRAIIMYNISPYPSPGFGIHELTSNLYLLPISFVPLFAFALSLALQRLAPAT